jgi:hypothetical protein
MDFIFDGINEIITPADAPILGSISIDVRDLYSR